VINIWPRRGWAAAATVAIAAFAGDADASVQTLVGVDHVTFAWQAAAGDPSGYLVTRSLNGGPFETYAFTVTKRIDIPVAPGNQVAIAVAATRYDSNGRFQVGPSSPVSDGVSIAPAPQLSSLDSILLLCETCSLIARRPLANASTVSTASSTLASPWTVLGHAALDAGSEAIVWLNGSTGQLAVWDATSLTPIPGATGVGASTLRGVGGADLDRDGVEEFLTQRTDTLQVSAWSLTSSGFRRVAQLTAPPGARLAAARDFDLDGRVDLIWQDTVSGALSLSTLAPVPILGGTLVTLSTLSSRLLSTTVPSTARVASTGDYDGDRSPDLLVRDFDGNLDILYLNRGVSRAFVPVRAAAGDVMRYVIDSVEMDGDRGDEIALWNAFTGEISVLDPQDPSYAPRIVVLSAGSTWRTIAIVVGS
jgi:hypothetical protein